MTNRERHQRSANLGRRRTTWSSEEVDAYHKRIQELKEEKAQQRIAEYRKIIRRTDEEEDA